MGQYMALSKKDPLIHITLNELYNMHSLILQHVETLVSDYAQSLVPPLTLFRSARTTSSTCVFSPTNSDLLLLRFPRRKIAHSSFSCTADGRRPPSKTSKDQQTFAIAFLLLACFSSACCFVAVASLLFSGFLEQLISYLIH